MSRPSPTSTQPNRAPKPAPRSRAQTKPEPVRHEAPEVERTPGRRVDFKASPTLPVVEDPAPTGGSEAPNTTPPSNLPTPEEAANHPLVQAVLKTFDGSVKNVYPRK